MLAMTNEAAEAVERLVDRPGVPAGAMLRITAGGRGGIVPRPARALELALVAEPPASDLVVQDVRIAVEPASLPFLDDKVLDAELDESEVVEFRLYEQPR